MHFQRHGASKSPKWCHNRKIIGLYVLGKRSKALLRFRKQVRILCLLCVLSIVLVYHNTIEKAREAQYYVALLIETSLLNSALFLLCGNDEIITERIFPVLGNKSSVSPRYSGQWLTKSTRPYVVGGKKSKDYHTLVQIIRHPQQHSLLAFSYTPLWYRWVFSLYDKLAVWRLRSTGDKCSGSSVQSALSVKRLNARRVVFMLVPVCHAAARASEWMQPSSKS